MKIEAFAKIVSFRPTLAFYVVCGYRITDDAGDIEEMIEDDLAGPYGTYQQAEAAANLLTQFLQREVQEFLEKELDERYELHDRSLHGELH